MSETTKYLVTGATVDSIYDVASVTMEENGTLVLERVNWAGTSYIRVKKSPVNNVYQNKVYRLTEIWPEHPSLPRELAEVAGVGLPKEIRLTEEQTAAIRKLAEDLRA